MRINYGIEFRLASDPRTIDTRTGNVMLSLFGIFSKRKKVNGRWEDDPRYEAMKVNAIAFGDVANALMQLGLRKGDTIIITNGTIAKPRNTQYNDLEIMINDFELKDAGERGSNTNDAPVGSDEALSDLPF